MSNFISSVGRMVSNLSNNQALRKVQQVVGKATGSYIIDESGTEYNPIVKPFSFKFVDPETSRHFDVAIFQNGKIVAMDDQNRYVEVSPSRLLFLVERSTTIREYREGRNNTIVRKLIENLASSKLFSDTENVYGLFGRLMDKNKANNATKNSVKEIVSTISDVYKRYLDIEGNLDKDIKDDMRRDIDNDNTIVDKDREYRDRVAIYERKARESQYALDALATMGDNIDNVPIVHTSTVESLAKIVTEMGVYYEEDGSNATLYYKGDRQGGLIPALDVGRNSSELRPTGSNTGANLLAFTNDLVTKLTPVLSDGSLTDDEINEQLLEVADSYNFNNTSRQLTNELKKFINDRSDGAGNKLGIQNRSHEMGAMSSAIGLPGEDILETLRSVGIEAVDDGIELNAEIFNTLSQNIGVSDYSGTLGTNILRSYNPFDPSTDSDIDVVNFKETGHIKLANEIQEIMSQVIDDYDGGDDLIANIFEDFMPEDVETFSEYDKREYRSKALRIDRSTRAMQYGYFTAAAENTKQMVRWLDMVNSLESDQHELNDLDGIFNSGTAHSSAEDAKIQSDSGRLMRRATHGSDLNDINTNTIIAAHEFDLISSSINDSLLSTIYTYHAQKKKENLNYDPNILSKYEETNTREIGKIQSVILSKNPDIDKEQAREMAMARIVDRASRLSVDNDEAIEQLNNWFRVSNEEIAKKLQERDKFAGFGKIKLGRTNVDIGIGIGIQQGIGMAISNIIVPQLSNFEFGLVGNETVISSDKSLMNVNDNDDPTPIRDAISIFGVSTLLAKGGSSFKNNPIQLKKGASKIYDIIDEFGKKSTNENIMSRLAKHVTPDATWINSIKTGVSSGANRLLNSIDLVNDSKQFGIGALLSLGTSALAGTLGGRSKAMEAAKYQDEDYVEDYKYIKSLVSGETPNYMIGGDEPINNNSGITPLKNLNYNANDINDEDDYSQDSYSQISSHSKMSIVRSGTRR